MMVESLVRKPIFWAFSVTGFIELGLLVGLGGTTFSWVAAAVLVALVAWLGSGSVAAWWIFVAANGLLLVTALLFAVGTTHGGGGPSAGTSWGNVLIMSAGSAALLVMLFSPPMRRLHQRHTTGW